MGVIATAPAATARPYNVESPNGVRTDEYYWLRDDARENRDARATSRRRTPGRTLSSRPSNPCRKSCTPRSSAGSSRMIRVFRISRAATGITPATKRASTIRSTRARHSTMDAPEQILLNVNELAKGFDFFEVAELAVSPDSRMLAWAEDAVGRRQFVLRIKDLQTGATLPDRIENTSRVTSSGPQTIAPSCTWRRIRSRCWVTKFASTCSARTRSRIRWSGNRRTKASTPASARRRMRSILLIGTQSTVSSEYWYADAADPQLEFKLFAPRERDHEYQLEHFEGHWILRTNWQAKNFRIVEVSPGDETRRDRWRDLVPHRHAGLRARLRRSSGTSSPSRSAREVCARSASARGRRPAWPARAACAKPSSPRISRRIRCHSAQTRKSIRTSSAMCTRR